MLYKLYLLLFAAKTLTCSCNFENKHIFKKSKIDYSISKVGKLPICINENSGIIKAWQDGYYWTHNDSGGSPDLYMIDAKGMIYDTLNIPDAVNIDWEDLSKDTEGNIYIGDFGNNSQSRKDLVIYKYYNRKTEKITFHYADQERFPSTDKNFDCEAFFWFNNKLYLFSKSWDKKIQKSKIYEVPDKPGDYALLPISSIDLKAQITSADISPDGKMFALLSYGKTFLFGIENGKINFEHPISCSKTSRSQSEAIAFLSENELIITNEQRKLYKLKVNVQN